MVKELRTPDQLGEILADVEYIARNLRDVRARMIEEGLTGLELQDGTARFHLNWVKGWSDTVMPTLNKALIERDAKAKRKETESKRTRFKGKYRK